MNEGPSISSDIQKDKKEEKSNLQLAQSSVKNKKNQILDKKSYNKLKVKAYLGFLFFLLFIILLVTLYQFYLDVDNFIIFFNPEDHRIFEPPSIMKLFNTCPEKYEYRNGLCYYYLDENPVTRKLKYCWFGESREISTVLYEGTNRYIYRLLEKEICEGNIKNMEMLYLKLLNIGEQDIYINNLVEQIKEISIFRDFLVKIVVSMVKNIPTDNYKNLTTIFECKKKISIFPFNIEKSINFTFFRAPYNVLYENIGVENEKAILLTLLLSKLNYGVSLIKSPYNDQLLVGIKCRPEYANYFYNNTSYCIIYPDFQTYDATLSNKLKIIFTKEGAFMNINLYNFYDWMTQC